MSPYIQFQESLIKWLKDLQNQDPDILYSLVHMCRSRQGKSLDWRQYLKILGFDYGDEPWEKRCKISDLILEQIEEESDGKLRILNLLGWSLIQERTTADISQWRENSSMWWLRTERCAEARALCDGDVLFGDQVVVGLPREGGNGSVLVNLQHPLSNAYWNEFPERLVLALKCCYSEPELLDT